MLTEALTIGKRFYKMGFIKIRAMKVYARQRKPGNRAVFSFRERESLAGSFLKFRYSLKFPPELPVRDVNTR